MKTIGLFLIFGALSATLIYDQRHHAAVEARLDRLAAQLQALAAVPAAPPAAAPTVAADCAPDGECGDCAEAAAAPAAVADPDLERHAVAVDGAPFEGPSDALVTIVVASEYACPYCAKARTTLAELRRAYGDDLRLVHRSFVVHAALATGPARAACAAGRQGRFAAMSELLWSQAFGARELGRAHLEALAGQAGLDLTRFRADRDGACAEVVDRDQRELAALGVRGTPTFFINGRRLIGAQPAAAFRAVIDEELARARTAVAAGEATAATYYDRAVLGR